MTSVGDRIGCVTVLEVLEAAQARERDLRGYRGSAVHPDANGTHVWVRCDCLLEFLVRAREVTRRKGDVRCGHRCELGRGESERSVQEWTRCRSPLCQAALRADNRSGFCKTCRQLYPGRRWYLMTLPGFMQHRRKYTKDYRKKMVSRGVCIRCSARMVAGKKCETCKAWAKPYKAARRARLARFGLCESCAIRDVKKDRRRCEACLRRQSAWKERKKAREARRAAA